MVCLDELKRLVRVARINDDGVLSPDERQRAHAYLRERANPIVGTANRSLVDVRVMNRKPVEGYVKVEHQADAGSVVFNLDVSTNGHCEHAKKIIVRGITPNSRDDVCFAVNYHRYGVRGENSSVGYQAEGSGAGYLAAISDKERGAILVNLSVAGALAGDAPDVRTLFTAKELAAHPLVKQLARKQGFDPKTMRVELVETSFHSDFVDKSRGPRAAHAGFHTLLLRLELSEPGSHKAPRQVQLSALVRGNVLDRLSKLDIDELEEGVFNPSGFLFPASCERG